MSGWIRWPSLVAIPGEPGRAPGAGRRSGRSARTAVPAWSRTSWRDERQPHDDGDRDECEGTPGTPPPGMHRFHGAPPRGDPRRPRFVAVPLRRAITLPGLSCRHERLGRRRSGDRVGTPRAYRRLPMSKGPSARPSRRRCSARLDSGGCPPDSREDPRGPARPQARASGPTASSSAPTPTWRRSATRRAPSSANPWDSCRTARGTSGRRRWVR
jgi:hypothetical protein